MGDLFSAGTSKRKEKIQRTFVVFGIKIGSWIAWCSKKFVFFHFYST